MKKLIQLLLLLLTGCANVTHHRSVTTSQTGVKTVEETESARFFFQREAAQKVSSQTKDSQNEYSHTVTATGVQATGDVELIKAIGDAVGKGIAAGAKSAVGAP